MFFWGAVAEGYSYDGAMDEVWDFIGNNAIVDDSGSPDWVDDEASYEQVMNALTESLPESQEELDELQASWHEDDEDIDDETRAEYDAEGYEGNWE